ncbi:DUF6316 family protein [Marinobacter sp. M216]|uniref:DUF6316 family protein n=1 Tax=Marinobacter albus TaxID=3030833 RepID=A0ABT7H9R9_9GAMM|nr:MULTISPECIES: DUF6316 family protein [unclassified Marinobacter]MBW7470645.1 hypothetical protein [Marinobacter sp. F4218]MDK9557087.1 DUF6316 family protein [Marinobacter sp. M216]
MRTDTAIPSTHQNRLMHTLYGWYALTREQADLGPFATSKEASDALSCHIKAYKGLNKRTPGALKAVHLHDADQCSKTNCGLCVEARIFWHSLAVATP